MVCVEEINKYGRKEKKPFVTCHLRSTALVASLPHDASAELGQMPVH